MGIHMSANGNSSGEGFLIAPSEAQTFPVPVGLRTTDGSSVNASLNAVTNGVQVDLSQTEVTVGLTETSIPIVAKSASGNIGDITLQVKVNGQVEASFALTSISNPQVLFTGRFQARFATDGDFYNDPRGGKNGWTWALEGEPDVVPRENNVPVRPGMAVGRVVRFHDLVALRSHVAPIGVFVTAVEGEVGGTRTPFAVGDSIIGEKVNLGPDSYLAANEPSNPADPPPFESYRPGFEPIENFEFHIGDRFSGKPASLQDRPKANGFFGLTQEELQKYGIIPLGQFNAQRKAVLLEEYRQLPPQDRTGTVEGRNLRTRISHLGGSQSDNIPSSVGTLPFGWAGKEVYTGLINDSIQNTPADSAVLAYFRTFEAFMYVGTCFNFHSDELYGRVNGTVSAFTADLQRNPSA